VSRTIFRNANVVDAEKGSRAETSVIIDGERIAAVGGPAATPARPDDREVDLEGRTLMPGLVSCHFHTIFDGVSPASGPSLGLQDPPAYLALVAAKNVGLALECGLTSIVCSSTAYWIDTSLKRSIEEGWVPGPRMLAGSHELMTTGDLASGGSHNWHMQLGNSGVVRTVDGADGFRAVVRDEIKKGAEVVKISAGGGHNAGPTLELTSLSDAELQTAVATAHARHARVRAHTASKAVILQCARAGVDIVDHADRIDTECIDALIASGSTVAPTAYYVHRTLEAFEAGAFNAMFDGSPPPMLQAIMSDMREGLDSIASMLPEMISSGLRVVAGDDFGTSFLPHGQYGLELVYYVKELGIAARDVLHWATQAGADLMGMGDELGSVREGKLADLLVVAGDPLTDIACLERRENVLAVLKGGEVVAGALP
jgi:imidazolonepropionase-like amidohydrolase